MDSKEYFHFERYSPYIFSKNRIVFKNKNPLISRGFNPGFITEEINGISFPKSHYETILIAQNNETSRDPLIFEGGIGTGSQSRFSEDEITVITEDLTLKKHKIIKNRKVVLDMVTINTRQYNFIIISEEFVSNNSVIQNF